MSSDFFAPFRPTTALELLLDDARSAVDAAERATEAYSETTPRIMETDSMGITYITYPGSTVVERPSFYYQSFEPETEEVSVHVQLGSLKIVTEFDSEVPAAQVQLELACQLSDDADQGVALIVGPLIIPAQNVPGIVFASVRTMDEAEEFNVHLYGNGS